MPAQIDVLRNKKLSLLAHAKGINDKLAEEGRAELSADEDKSYKADLAEVESINAGIKRCEELQTIEKQIADDANKARGNGTAPPETANGTANLATTARKADQINFNMIPAPKHFIGANGLPDRETAYKCGRWLQAAIYQNADSMRWLRDNAPSMLSSSGELAVSSGQGAFINSAGGFLVPEELSNQIIVLREKYGVFRKEVKVWPMGSDTQIVPRRTGGLTTYYVAENNDTTASQKTWDAVQLVAKMLACLVRYPTSLAEDAVISLADNLADEIAYAFAKEEDTAGFTGDGSAAHGSIQGVVKLFQNNTGYTGNYTAAAGHTGFSTITITDLEGLIGTLPQYALESGNCKWFVSATGWALMLQRLMYGSGSFGGNRVSDMEGGTRREFMGFPVVISQVLNTTTGAQTSTQGLCLFGDLKMAAMLGDRRGLSINTSRERYFEFNQIAIQGTQRYDINVHDIGSSTVGGPIVCLGTPAS